MDESEITLNFAFECLEKATSCNNDKHATQALAGIGLALIAVAEQLRQTNYFIDEIYGEVLRKKKL